MKPILSICVIGSVNTDMVVKVKNLPAAGETVLGGTFFMNPGGKGGNQAVAAARLGGKVTFVANVGNDVFGQQAFGHFANENITTDYITTDKDHPSGVALIGVDHAGENNIIVAPGANTYLDVSKVKKALASLSDDTIVLLQLEIPLETIAAAINYCHEKKLKVILNPAPAQKLDTSLLSKVFLITPNETEASLLTGVKVIDEESAAVAAKKLRESGVKNVIITLGSLGSYLQTENISKLIRVTPVQAVDSTAAGDCFSGALTVAIAENKTIEEAIAFAGCAAGISVTRLGAQASMPYRKEVDLMLLATKI